MQKPDTFCQQIMLNHQRFIKCKHLIYRSIIWLIKSQQIKIIILYFLAVVKKWESNNCSNTCRSWWWPDLGKVAHTRTQAIPWNAKWFLCCSTLPAFQDSIYRNQNKRWPSATTRHALFANGAIPPLQITRWSSDSLTRSSHKLRTRRSDYDAPKQRAPLPCVWIGGGVG